MNKNAVLELLLTRMRRRRRRRERERGKGEVKWFPTDSRKNDERCNFARGDVALMWLPSWDVVCLMMIFVTLFVVL